MDAILVVVGWFLKLAKMVLTKTIVTTFDMEKIVIDMWVNNHKMLQFIVNNLDAKFMVKFLKDLFQKVGMKLSFHPQTTGQLKRVNGVLNWYFINYMGVDHMD